MSSSPGLPSPPGDEPSSNGRLDSWKEIASYLKRSVRTVKRWEKGEGLPVHRHHHDKRDTVYAYRPELDAWWNRRRESLTERQGAEEAAPPLAEPAPPDLEPDMKESERAGGFTRPPPRRSRRAAWIGAGFGLAVVTVALVAWLSRNASERGSRLPPLAFQARDWILVTSFDNRTGEAILDGTVEYMLERELSNSRHVNVIPRERVGDVLRLMRKPPDTRIDAALGREISVRDGEIRVLLTGRAEKLGPRYSLSAQLLDPQTGTAIAGMSEEAEGHASLPRAVGRLSDQIRQRLGERLEGIPKHREKLENVTTVSLRALQLYSQGMALVNEGSSGAAAELLEHAVAQDPEFASAHILLAHCYSNLGKKEEAAPHYERAFQLAEATADRERYFILGSYYDRFLEDQEKAAQAYEALLRLYPEHYWGTNNLYWTYTLLGRHPEAAQLAARSADLRPRDFRANVEAAQALAFFGRDLRQTREYVARARELLSPDLRERFADTAAWLEVFPALEKWSSADPQAALKEVETAAQKIDSLAGREREELADYVAHVYLCLGRLDAAEQTLEAIPAPVFRHEFLARVAFIRGNDAAMRNHLGHPRRAGEQSLTTAVLLARAGLIKDAEQLVSGFLPGHGLVPRGELALAKGQTERALALLKDGTQERWSRGWSRGVFLLGSESLAGQLKAKGDLPGAIQVLEGASERQLTHAEAFWLRNRFQLAQLYREVGREEEARKIESELLNLLAVADSDHPMLLELQRLRTQRRPA